VQAIVLETLALGEHIHVLIVDDGSPDGTAQLVQQLQPAFDDRLFLLERAKKAGLGTAYIAGFGFALAHDYAFICEMDADFSHNPADLLPLIQAVAQDQTDIAIGSRYINGIRIINWPISRLVLSYCANIYTRSILKIPVLDATAGFKCFRRNVLEKLDLSKIKSNGYSFQIEMHYRAWKAGFRIKEIPIIFTERSEGLSKMSKSIMREAALKVWELRFRTLFGRL
jgi:dolichol-phosphate mannosyltransferase